MKPITVKELMDAIEIKQEIEDIKKRLDKLENVLWNHIERK